MMVEQDFIYHIVPQAEWDACSSSEIYQPQSLLKEGFIHFSFHPQVIGTAKRYYSQFNDLLLLKVTISSVSSHLKIEKSDAGMMFPHLYCPLSKQSIIDIYHLKKKDNEDFSWQED